MKSLNEFLSINEARKPNNYITLVETKDGLGFLFGPDIHNPFDPQQVQEILKGSNIDWVAVNNDWEDMDEGDVLFGAIYIPGETRIKWYDLMDGTVEEYKFK